MLANHIPLTSINVLLQKAGLNPVIKNITRCNGGGNNRIYLLQTKEGRFAVKQYFRQQGDTRDRLSAEFNFLTYAKEIAPQFIPQPYAQDAKNGIALYEYIDGNPIKSNELSEKEINLAIEFFLILNNFTERSKANNINLASEACFSLHEHITLIDHRLNQLNHIPSKTSEDKLAKKLITHLTIAWQRIIRKIQQTVDPNTFNAELELTQRCISPSDFGFHNALRTSNGIRFLDFEYAGWDDPAKMVGDFFAQLAVPIPAKFFANFTQQVMQPFSQSHDLIARANYLRKVYQVKWCCIALNIFLPLHLERRLFANPDVNVVILKKNQLTKVNTLIKLLEYQHGLY